MNKPSFQSTSPRETTHIGVQPRLSKAPSGVFARLKRMTAVIGVLVAAACSYNPISRSSAVSPDAGQDAQSDADSGVDAMVGMDSGADSGVDSADSGVDAGGDAGAADVPPPCANADGDMLCDVDDLCPTDPATDDADGDGCDDSNGDDVCLGNSETNADSDGDGMGDGVVIAPDGRVTACDPYPSCNPVRDGALPDAAGRFPSQEIWCDGDDDSDGVRNQEDCFPADASRDCSDRADGGVTPADGGATDSADAGPDASIKNANKIIQRLLRQNKQNGVESVVESAIA